MKPKISNSFIIILTQNNFVKLFEQKKFFFFAKKALTFIFSGSIIAKCCEWHPLFVFAQAVMAELVDAYV